MSISTARDEMFAMLAQTWEAEAGSLVDGYVPVMLWQGQEPNEPPVKNQAYGRATVLHATGNQASLAGAGGARRWSRNGVVIVQCFGPLSGGEGLTVAEGLATIALNTYEGKASTGGIWFRNCRINEVGPSNGWFQVNMVADFHYDEVK